MIAIIVLSMYARMRIRVSEIMMKKSVRLVVYCDSSSAASGGGLSPSPPISNSSDGCPGVTASESATETGSPRCTAAELADKVD